MAAFSPDTCGCRFVFNGEHDPTPGTLTDYAPLDDVEAASAGHNSGGTRLCPIHSGLDPAEAMKQAVMDINQTKNIYAYAVEERAKRLYPDELVELNGKYYKEDENGNLKRVPQVEVDARLAAKTMDYAVKEDGTLEVYLPDMPIEERAELDADVAFSPTMQVIDVERPQAKLAIVPISTKLALDAATK